MRILSPSPTPHYESSSRNHSGQESNRTSGSYWTNTSYFDEETFDIGDHKEQITRSRSTLAGLLLDRQRERSQNAYGTIKQSLDDMDGITRTGEPTLLCESSPDDFAVKKFDDGSSSSS